MTKTLFSKYSKQSIRHIMLTSSVFLALASASLTGCGAASASSYKSETAAAYDTSAGMPASLYKSSTGFSNDAEAETYAAAGNHEAAPEDFSADSGSAELSQEAILSQEVSNPGTDPARTSDETSPAPVERKLIRNVSMNLETREFDALTKSISDAVTFFGGYMEQADVSGNSLYWSGERSSRYSNITARIPENKLDAFLTEVSSQGNVTYKNESVQDVTLQYTDITSRKKTLQMEQERLWELLEKAESVDAVIALEARLSEVRYQLESIESQLRTLNNQIVYSTVYLSIQEVQVLTSTDPDTIPVRIQKGLSRSFNTLKISSVDFLVWFISSLPILAVFAVLVFIAVIILKKPLKRRKTRKQKGMDKTEATNAQTESKEEHK
ncbi:DUF4349 domain-containing protein, partial [Clostridium sp. AM33-3]|uniref:DUF4349 domain-containing protein n=1 Tax=Clostridium sp. AM33-3 TaxID=2292304 RepID=UPI001A9B11E3